MNFAISKIPKDVDIQRKLTSIHIDDWLREMLFHFKWWVLLGLILISLILWWNFIDKSRLHEICLYAALSTIIVLGLVEYGEELTLVDFPIDLIPIFPPLSSINLISLPLIYSLIYQQFRTWKSFILVSLIITTVFCFIIEPILAWGGLFHLLKWKYYYSFPIYVLMAICIRAVLIKILAINEKSKI